MDEIKRLERWQKFPLDSDVVIGLRAMLNLREDEEFPESLWIVMGIHKALEARFTAHPWSHRDLACMIVESQAMLVTMKAVTNTTKYVRGEGVLLTNMNREGRYWSPGPLGLHLVNCDGDVFLVKSMHIEAPESAIADSQLNVDARAGKKNRKGELVSAGE